MTFPNATVLSLALLLAGIAAPVWAQDQVFRSDHVTVFYQGVDVAQVQAIAAVIETARAAAATRFGLDMPATITLRLTIGADQPVRLFNDGKDEFRLSLQSPADLRKPAESGIFHLYGLCHEVGHLGMYRPIAEHAWLTTAGAEGWAHYVGSVLVDDVYAKLGAKGWPDEYDYRADGTARLDRQLASGKADETTRGAGLWREWVQIIGEAKVATVFRAWGQAKIDPTNPRPVLEAEVAKVAADPRLADWWKRAEPLLLARQAASAFKAGTVAAKDLTGKPVELARDDGQPASKKSVAGGGHAVDFEAPGPGSYLTAIAIHGARYGLPQAPAQSFHVWLLDEQGKTIADFPFPYGSFARGTMAWVKLPVKPTAVPAKFTLCAGFNPTATNGVFVSHSAQNTGHSRSGLPGKLGEGAPGDWLLRAVVDRAKDAGEQDPLQPGK